MKISRIEYLKNIKHWKKKYYKVSHLEKKR